MDTAVHITQTFSYEFQLNAAITEIHGTEFVPSRHLANRVRLLGGSASWRIEGMEHLLLFRKAAVSGLPINADQ